MSGIDYALQWRCITSRYDRPCAQCGRRVGRGARVMWCPGVGHIFHVDLCFNLAQSSGRLT
jgi:hypothetical protein